MIKVTIVDRKEVVDLVCPECGYTERLRISASSAGEHYMCRNCFTGLFWKRVPDETPKKGKWVLPEVQEKP